MSGRGGPERPALLRDGYAVMLDCGHVHRWASLPELEAEIECRECGAVVDVLDVVPAYVEPPALRGPWVRLLSRMPRLQRLVDRLMGRWPGDLDG